MYITAGEFPIHHYCVACIIDDLYHTHATCVEASVKASLSEREPTITLNTYYQS